jgi:uroporphyrin-III C-methyltransferase
VSGPIAGHRSGDVNPGRPSGTRPGMVHLVGAGPGDPDLITVRAARLLASADAIVHDRLIPHAVLELARPGVTLFDAGKEGHSQSVPQQTTSDLLIRLGRAGLDVVRLKGGDPFVFGRGGEEALALRAAGIPFEIVPGVTAGVAGPAFAGIPVTHRGLSRGVAFVTATTAETADGAAVEWSPFVAIDTLVVFMAGRTSRAVARGLIAAGRSRLDPVAIVIAASRPDQEVHLIDLATLAVRGAGPLDGRPVLLVIGPVAALANELAWFAGDGLAGAEEGRADPPDPIEAGAPSRARRSRLPVAAR